MQRGRVRSACLRCRRQKLKCDPSLPCQLCVRSGVQCVSSTDLSRGGVSPAAELGTHSTKPAKRKADILPRDTKTRRTQNQAESVTQMEYLPTFRLVEQIFATRRKANSLEYPTHPTKTPRRSEHHGRDEPRMSIESILGESLPPPQVTDILVASYIRAMHWYVPLIHVSSFQARLSTLLHENTCSYSDRPFLLLSVSVILMGLYFASPEDMERVGQIISLSMPALQTRFLSFLEKSFLESFNQYNLDWICFSSLLSMYYLLNQRPRRASIVMGSTIQAARDMRLDRTPAESASMTTLEVEIRKRVWWTLYAGDGFAAVVAGHAPTIRTEDMSVTEPLDMEDNSTQSTEFPSVEVREDGSLKPVTTYSFHRYRTKLYRVAARLNTRRHTSRHDFEAETQDIFAELDGLRKTLPKELCLDSYSNTGFVEEGNSAGRVFRLQALTLRVLCEHIQLLLFRPFIAYDADGDSPVTHGSSSASYTDIPDDTQGLPTLARSRCFQSAMCIARVDQHHDILRLASKTPLVTHLGVLSFTSGAILGTLALLDPTSARARECKMGVARIIKIPRIASFRNALWDQATETLKDVLRIICSEEVESLLVGDFPLSPAQSTEEDTPTASGSASGWRGEVQRENLTDDEVVFPSADLTGFEDMEVFAECYTAFTDLYGPSIGLENFR